MAIFHKNPTTIIVVRRPERELWADKHTIGAPLQAHNAHTRDVDLIGKQNRVMNVYRQSVKIDAVRRKRHRGALEASHHIGQPSAANTDKPEPSHARPLAQTPLAPLAAF